MLSGVTSRMSVTVSIWFTYAAVVSDHIDLQLLLNLFSLTYISSIPCRSHYLIGSLCSLVKQAAIKILSCNVLESEVRLVCVRLFQEKAKANEEKRQNKLEFRQFLESCGFIKVSSFAEVLLHILLAFHSEFLHVFNYII